MKRLLIATALLLATLATVFGQSSGVPYFPQTLPGETVVGRLSKSPGATEAIPFKFLRDRVLLSSPVLVKEGGTGATTAQAARTNLGAGGKPVTSVHDPNGQSNTGANVPTLNENWMLAANQFWVRSSDLSIYPFQIQVGGTWVNGDIAKFRITTGAVNYDVTVNVVTGQTTNTQVAANLHAQTSANAPLIALPTYPQPFTSGAVKFDVGFMYPQHPVTSSNLSTTAGGTLTLTNPINLLDGPVGLNIQRLSPGRAPLANDNIGGLIFWGPYDAGGNGVGYGRIDTFIDNPALASLAGRMQFLTGDQTVSDNLLRMVIRKGVYLANASGAAPSGGTLGDMGAGSINTPIDAGYHVDGQGVFKFGSGADSVQLFSAGSKKLQLGTNSNIRLNFAANGSSIYPETDGGPDLGIASTNKFGSVFLKSGAVLNLNNGDVTVTHSSDKLAFAGAASGYTYDDSVVTGHTAKLEILSNSNRKLQVYGNDGATPSLALGMFSSTATDQPHILFYRSRDTTVGNATVVQSGDSLGGFFWVAAQQTGTFTNQKLAAGIGAEVDGTVTSGAGADMPARLVFRTSLDGTDSFTERMRIDNKGHINFPGTAPALTSCGTSPSITGSDVAGSVTMGTGAPTGCVITFAQAYTSTPHCIVVWIATPLASQSYATSTTAITLTQTATSSNTIKYHCFGL